MAFNLGSLSKAMFPQGAQGLGQALQAASPLLMSMAAGMQQGNPYALMGEGVEMMRQRQQDAENTALFDPNNPDGLFGMGGAGQIAGAQSGFTGLGGATGTVQGGPMAQTMPGGGGPVGAGAVQTMPGTGGGPVGAGALQALPGPGPTRGSAAVLNGLIQRGLPRHIAAGMVMAAQDESGLDPTINEQNPTVAGSRGGFGLMQWTGPRRVALEQFAQQRGTDPGDMDTQLDFLMAEMQGPEKAAAQRVMSARDPGEAAALMTTEFLRPAPEHAAQRVAKYTGQAPQQVDPMQDPQVQRLATIMGRPGLSDAQRDVVGIMLQQRLGQLQPAPAMTPYQQAQIDLERQKMAQGGQITPYQQQQLDLQQQRLALDRQRAEVGSRGEYGLTPIWGTDAQGNPVLMQPKSTGGVEAVQMPEGVQPNYGVDKVDAGDHWLLIDKKSGAVVGEQPKNVRAEEREKGIGRAEGESLGDATANIGKIEAQSQTALELIDSIVGDPALPGITGIIQGRLPPMSQGGADLNAKIDQLKGKTFLEAFESLKGGGQITEVEGKKAEEAIARLNRTQSPEAYIEALADLRSVIEIGLQRARSKAGQVGPAAPPAGGGLSPDAMKWLGGN